MTTSNLVYLTQGVTQSQAVLERYLPRLHPGAAERWLRSALPKQGEWIIDPFGASPQLALEAAQAGYRILVISNNPITRFLLEMMATPPSEEEMQAALADLATARRGSERLEQHIRALYATSCDQCGETVDAQAFFWQRDALTPYARKYACPHCGHSGEFPTTDADIDKATQFASHGPHRARAIERVAASGDPNRIHAEEALDTYLPRAVYVLLNLINKLDGIDLEAREGVYLQALLLAACDRGNNLWRIPKENVRPKQLTTPPRFVEHNLWLALETAIPLWANGAPATPLTYWPEGPPESGGICLYQGQVRDLTTQLDQIPVGAMITAMPRPNQAYWTLSALWAGWLWGREAIGPFVKVLRRRRYDWAWHTAALYSPLRRISRRLPTNTPYLGMITENEAGFDTAAMVAADLADFQLDGVALRIKEGQTHLLWHKAETRPDPPERQPINTVFTSIQQAIAERGEPSPYLHLQAAALLTLSQANALSSPGLDAQAPRAAQANSAYSNTRQLLAEALAPHGPFVRYQGGKSSIEIGKWWPKAKIETSQPLADRVEMSVVTLFQRTNTLPWAEIDAQLCTQFPGLETPDATLLRAILQSYAEEGENNRWTLRESDTAAARRADVAEMFRLLEETGTQLGFNVRRETSLVWEGALDGKPLHFYMIASAILGRIIHTAQHPPEQGIIVLPGSRAGLVMHKRERDPRLDYDLEGGWRFLKFRYVRRLAESERISPENLASHFALDPLSHEEAQLPLL